MSEFEKELDGILEIIKDEKFYNSKLYALPSIEELKAHFKDWQPPKELVEVPQIVADWLENNEDDLSFKIWGYLINWKLQDKKSDFFKWMKKETECIETLIRMQDGYTVEKEKEYILKHIDLSKNDKEKDWYLAKKVTGKLYHSWGEKGREHKGMIEGQYFTQSEIDELNTGSYEQIAVKVED